MLEKISNTDATSRHFSPLCSFVIVVIIIGKVMGLKLPSKQGAQVYYFHLSGCVFPSHLSVLIG